MQWSGLVPPLLVANPFGVFRSLIGPKGDERPAKSPPANPFVRDGRTLVSVVHGTDVPRMVAEAIALIGGMDRLAVRGKTVLVKPNVVSSDPSPTTTNPVVVAAVVRVLIDAGARRVIVGEMSGLARLPTSRNLEETGVARAARDAGAEVITFDDGEWIEIAPPQGRLVKRIHVARPVYEADLFVNVPVVKTHAYAGYSICLKNLVGITHPRYRPYRINASKWEELVAEMNLAAHPTLNVVDATTCMIAGGPVGGTAATTNLIMASGDRVAADVVGLALIAHFKQWEKVTSQGVWEQRQIRHAQALGVGLVDPANLALVTRSLESDAADFTKLLDDVRRLVGMSAVPS
jgi:uncharacterized protein (DUF362 family)